MTSGERSVAAVVDPFLTAARFASHVVSDVAIGDAWLRPSVLAEMTVGDVAGHLFLIVRRVGKHLDEPASGAGMQLGEMALPRVDTQEDLTLTVHATVRADGHHVAAWGWSDVRDALSARVLEVGARLERTTPQTVAIGNRRIDFTDYLSSRVVELLVHADDLLLSADLDDLSLPEQSMDVALSYLLAAARRTHGDREVLRAFSRRERTLPGVPSVY